MRLMHIPKIYKTSSPRFPHLAFEWHEASAKVYVLEIPGSWGDGGFFVDESARLANGTCIGEHCETHARFYGVVQTWLRGVRFGETKPRPKTFEARDVNSCGIPVGCEPENIR